LRRKEKLKKFCALLGVSPLVTIPIEQPQAPSFDENNEIYIQYKFQISEKHYKLDMMAWRQISK
jgi:hypothetical protein